MQNIKDLRNVSQFDRLQLRITVSIGWAACPENATSAANLVIAADKALYEAKRSGKNRVVESAAQLGKTAPGTYIGL
jgi:diguanylate cyclase (GGDEF)-like protein